MLGKRLIAGFHHCTNSPCWSKSATPKHILGVSLSQLLRQWRSWRTGSAAYGVNTDPELTFASHTKRVAARCFYKLRQLRTIRHSLSADNARMLVHALVSTQVDYCNSILYQVAAVHLRPLQSVLTAAARLIVRKHKYDHITPTLRDDLHWLPVHRRIEYKLIHLPGRPPVHQTMYDDNRRPVG